MTVIRKKRLPDRSELFIEKYMLPDNTFKDLGMPASSDEFVLGLRQERNLASTSPTASWYLTQEDFDRLFDAIRNEGDFKKVVAFLYRVKSEEDAKKISAFLEELVS